MSRCAGVRLPYSSASRLAHLDQRVHRPPLQRAPKSAYGVKGLEKEKDDEEADEEVGSGKEEACGRR